MGDAAEAFVQITPDSSGKKVRNLQLDVLQPDGTTATVFMQVLSIVDESGKPFTDGNEFPTTDRTNHELLTRAVELLEQIAATLQE